MTSYESLGVRRIINAAAMQTSLGGSLMPAEVLDALARAAGSFVSLDELHDRVGERIARLTRNEGACVVNGAAAGLMLATAACFGDDEDADGRPVHRSEVVVMDAQRNGYLTGVAAAGGRLVGVPAGGRLAECFGLRTACVVLFAGQPWEALAPPLDGLIRAARDAGVPVVVDAADQVPPLSSLWHYTGELGADLVVISGGKGLRGPQSSGLVLGRRDLVARCRELSPPRLGVGRTSKVGKEEIVGLLAAVEHALRSDEDAQLRRYARAANHLHAALTELPNVVVTLTERSHSGQPIPRVLLQIGSSFARDAAVARLWNLDPRIAVLAEGERTIALNPQQLTDDETDHVVRMVFEVLRRGD
ncbi:aminotransferase class V-fold PLP-dependent enzyme [Jiangella gansuensis]|uniref:aminotransferase class V-fold PLP-dependent enzyme n=1 Tax=Jiangella gansuensis TaxID=281473 RepID=UPI00047922EF|nr:aminotransferase class V-fold PLP-dependent enzyme [Jiangella gansuensis]